MRTETDWKSEIRSQGQESARSHKSEYSDKLRLSGSNLPPYLTREGRGMDILPRKYIMSYPAFSQLLLKAILKRIIISLILYIMIPIYLFLNLRGKRATLASFYQHQRSPQRASLDKIETWVDKERYLL
ncbi:9732_t:CDS:2 [Gigaspora rosea]|nr:9732_t:CDS:2 [Gigaspora rosea]